MTDTDRPVAPYDSRPETYAHIGRVRQLLGACIGELLARADDHDASKLVDPEREAFDRLTPKLREVEYGSDEYRGFLHDLGPALQHHYATNRHHPEHFAGGIHDMSLLDLLEMLCDWKAAGERTKNGDIRRSIEQNQERFGYSDELKAILLATVTELAL